MISMSIELLGEQGFKAKVIAILLADTMDKSRKKMIRKFKKPKYMSLIRQYCQCTEYNVKPKKKD